jgi:hypothetical protein
MLHAHLRGVEQQLQHWQYQSLTGTRDNTRLSLAFHFVRIHLYEKALFKDRFSHFQLVGAAGETSTPASGAQTRFFSALHATYAFLDDILTRPASLRQNMNIVEWTYLLTAAITLARLARQGPDQNREAGIEHLPIKTQVEVYIVTLCQRMADVGAGNVQDDPRGLFSWFKAIAQGIRLWVWGSEESVGAEIAEVEAVEFLNEWLHNHCFGDRPEFDIAERVQPSQQQHKQGEHNGTGTLQKTSRPHGRMASRVC